MKDRANFSVIIPTFRENAIIGERLAEISSLAVEEVIVVDGYSNDGTAAIVAQCASANGRIRFLETSASRPRQMNAGAAAAAGEWLLFLHADTCLPSTSFDTLIECIRNDPAMHAGAFYLRMDTEGWYYTYLEWYSRWRCRLFRLPYGDQALFVKKDVFDRMGGFREDHPIMEDVEFVRRLNRNWNFRMIPANVTTSARRFEHDGPVKRGLKNLGIQLLYTLGVKPDRLANYY